MNTAFKYIIRSAIICVCVIQFISIGWAGRILGQSGQCRWPQMIVYTTIIC